MVFLFILGIFLFPPSVHAIVILPAIVLIPLVKLVAVVVAALSVPTASIAVIVGKLTKKYRLVGILSFILLVLIAVFSALILKYFHPQNPWF